MARLVLRDSRIIPLVEAFIAVWDVTGGAPRAPVIPALLPWGYTHVAALALIALVGERGQRGVLDDLVNRGQRQGFYMVGELIRISSDEFLHVLLVRVRTKEGCGTVGVVQGVVGVLNGTPLAILTLDAPGPQVALDLPRLGVHQGKAEDVPVVEVTLATGLVHNPGVARVWVEFTRMGLLCGGGVGITVVAGRALAEGHDLLHHLALGGTDGLDALMTTCVGTVLLCRLLRKDVGCYLWLGSLGLWGSSVEEEGQGSHSQKGENHKPASFHALTSFLSCTGRPGERALIPPSCHYKEKIGRRHPSAG